MSDYRCDSCHLPCELIFVTEEGYNRRRSACCRAPVAPISRPTAKDLLAIMKTERDIEEEAS